MVSGTFITNYNQYGVQLSIDLLVCFLTRLPLYTMILPLTILYMPSHG
jgi:hypothetical protein